MIKNVSFIFVKEAKFTVSKLHLFEHCISTKISNILEQTYDGEGVIINAETFTDSVLIELFFTNSELVYSLVNILDQISFTDNDNDLIKAELELIRHETKLVDLTEEEKYLYKPLTFFSDLNIYDLYSSEVEMNNITEEFNNLIQRAKITSFKNGELSNITCSKSIENLSPIVKGKWEMKNEIITGCFVSQVSTLRELLLSKLNSFVFGRSGNSIISKEFLTPFNLYYGYTVDVSIYNYFCSLFYVETDDKSEKKFLNDPNLFNYFELDQIEFKRQVEAFKTYLLMNDPLLLEINKYYSKAGIGESVNSNRISDYLDGITLEDLRKHIRECVVI